MFLLFLLFLVSEGLLFVSFFWRSFHSLSSPTFGICLGEGFYLPDPCELTFANTLLLSNAAISLGNAFISLEISSQFLFFFSLFSLILAWTFISLQIKEFQIMGLPINDSVYSCVFFFLTGLHFFHLLLGLLLLILLFWSCSFSFQIFSQSLSLYQFWYGISILFSKFTKLFPDIQTYFKWKLVLVNTRCNEMLEGIQKVCHSPLAFPDFIFWSATTIKKRDAHKIWDHMAAVSYHNLLYLFSVTVFHLVFYHVFYILLQVVSGITFLFPNSFRRSIISLS